METSGASLGAHLKRSVKFSGKVYIAAICCSGLACWALAARDWRPADLSLQFAFYLVLAAFSSRLKVRLPGITGALSVNYVFILLAILDLGLPQTVAIAVASTIAQSILSSKAGPRPVQLLFNLGAISVFSTFAYRVYHSSALAALDSSAPMLLLWTASSYFLTNTMAVAAVIALTESKPVKRVWIDNFFWTAPHYLFGACLALIISVSNRMFGWQYSMLVMPGIYLLYRSYHLYLGRLEEEKKHVAEVADLHLRTIEALALAIEAKDDTTHSHLRRVQVYALEIAQELGLSQEEIRALEAAALLHDIGKLAVPEYIINKPGKLTKEEFEKMKVHPVVGAEILECVQFPYPVVPIVRSHHEKWDGSGYPDGLVAEAIPIGARILSAVDCLDALASDRQYRRALPLDKALEEVVKLSGVAFDPKVVDILRRRTFELEKKARIAPQTANRLSTRVRISRGEAPAAGLADAAGRLVPGAQSSRLDFIGSIAAARQEFQKLHEFTRDIGNSLSLDDTLSLVASRMKTLIPFDAIAIYGLEGDRLRAHHSSGIDADLFSSLAIPLGEGLAGWVAENRQPMVNGNPSVEAGYLRDGTKFSLLRSALSVPLDGLSGVVGVLTLYRKEVDAFSNEDLRIVLTVASKVGMTIENARTYHAAEKSAGTDKLTGLANGHSLVLQLEAELEASRQNGRDVTVLVLDLDGFKTVNDTLGHLEGNRVLQLTADGLRKLCRERDFVARLGGDEFAMILPGITADALDDRLPRLAWMMEEVDRQVGAGGVLAVSVGAAHYPADGASTEALLGAADRRMYQMKRKHHASRPELSPAR
jgi:diguanylate cyclase (GGDEF)-like protein/putative nucleotidyltransferase with HDIG domain